MITADEEVKRTYIVEVEEVRVHQFTVDEANSPEEAEGIAEEWLEDGEDGTILEKELTNFDSYPIQNKEDSN